MSAPNKRVQKQSNEFFGSQNALTQNLFAAMLFMDKGAFIQFEPTSQGGFQQAKPVADNVVQPLQMFENSGHWDDLKTLEHSPSDQPKDFPDNDSGCHKQRLEVVLSDEHTHEAPCPKMLVQIDTAADGHFTLNTSWLPLEPNLPTSIEIDGVKLATPLVDFAHAHADGVDVQARGSASLVDLSFLFQTGETSQAQTYTQWSSASGWGQINVMSSLEWIEAPVAVDQTQSTVGAPSYLHTLGFATAWASGYTGQGVVVANIDTGFDFTNRYLTNGINFSAYNWNFITDSSNVQDDNGHGTMTASEMVADPTTGFGVWGAAYDAQLMVLKALDASGKGSLEDVCEAIYYAVDHGANVINMSLGQTIPNSYLQTALQYAADHDVVVVAAAGNDAASGPTFPAAYGSVLPNVMAVGSSGLSITGCMLTTYSNQAGSSEAFNYVTAEGMDLVGFGLHNTMWSWTGTSMSSPLVAAQAAILESAKPELSASEILQAITGSADSLQEWLNAGSAVHVVSNASASSHATVGQFNLTSFDANHLSHQFPVEQVY